MNSWKSIADIRREYGQLTLSEETAKASPFAQFEDWFKEGLKTEKSDPTAMVLSTADEQGRPDSRVVLLKGIENESFVFYTNYQSTKAMQLGKNPYAALNFYWPQLSRQIRIRGRVKQVSAHASDAYFAARPKMSQLSALASPQSKAIESREVLEKRFNELIQRHQQAPVVRPEYWGGYQVIPEEIEFWQGRDNRLHDRIHYYKVHGQWTHRRLAP